MTKVLVFSLNGTKCGIEVSQIKEVFRTKNIMSIPNAPDFVEGVINLRGKIVPMINLRRRLGIVTKCVNGSVSTIILESRHGEVGLIVDEVSEITDVTCENISSMPNIQQLNIQQEKLFKGIGKLPDDSLILLLDPEKILPAHHFDAYAILNLLPDPIVIHDGKKILFANQKALDVFGEMGDVLQLAHPDHQHSMREQIERVLRGEIVEPNEKLVVTSEGKEIWFEITHTTIPGSSAILSIFRNVTEKKTELAKQRMLLRKAVEVSEVVASAKNQNEVLRRAENILADYNARISDYPENLSFAINHNGRRYGHLNVKSELEDDEKYVFRTLAKNLGFIMKSIEDKEKLLGKLSENIELIAYLVDRIRNPLAAIMGYAEFIDDDNIKQRIVSQVERIVGIISKLDFAWISSEDIMEKLQTGELDYNDLKKD
ncbi:MAG: chemotaxis protein CheW [Archaeoglobus sp.]|uniref:chemotaxis protein CheW n=1 Tax=Archaeoglobus sp. TaxID=1872626 RepID=UPI001D5CE898|nr:chemotaxis protein CheW [Archaeoglobus sp.]MBO8181010.1 chemotaxis protein CheW [Archaeoglobus sp.]